MNVAVPANGLLIDIILVTIFACLTALCAQICFWIGLVPVSGQTFGVLISGALLGSRRGAWSQISYLAIGTMGLPYWFAPGGVPGIARLLGPTGGYLLAFPIAAAFVGFMVELRKEYWWILVSIFLGSLIIFLGGTIQLNLVYVDTGHPVSSADFPDSVRKFDKLS